ncbi:hypothetical protein LUZ60_002539 [Juncus effusus]|nr:hypothetical protein LUZ60_002539 [Juncus effusus]
MCDFFWQSRMEEKSGEGDLTDILRAGGLNPLHTRNDVSTPDWSCHNLLPSGPTVQPPSSPLPDFGDPFLNIRDPLSDELSGLDFVESTNICTATGSNHNDVFSRVLQISPLVSTAEGIAGFEISSQRSLGLKRRKTQARKVVCIPAPASANGRAGGGEVVPSDLWAWRKYGQKPIKGSPYPRGYYRCSSSKGCLARKQVERSRTDPNMLVITYTSEHNHPWPTQRNALAGSTRSQFPKHNNSSNPKTTSHENSKRLLVKEETIETRSSHGISNDINTIVKDEIGDINKTSEATTHENDLHAIMSQGYDTTMPAESNLNPNDELFEDLGEFIPLGKLMETILDENKGGNKEMDPFELIDWVGN